MRKNPSPFRLECRGRQRDIDREWIKRGRKGEREVVKGRKRYIVRIRERDERRKKWRGRGFKFDHNLKKKCFQKFV